MSGVIQDRLFSSSGESKPGARGNATVFTPNMALPVHRWFRYSAGFSAAWVEDVVRARRASRSCLRVLDPFVGSGTTLIASQCAGADAVGLESHPLVARIASAKLAWSESADELHARGSRVLEHARPRDWPDPPPLLQKIYPAETLARLLGLRDAIEREEHGDAIDGLVWLALVAILRACSPVGTATWQYVLPNKSKARASDPLEAFGFQIRMMAADMMDMPSTQAQALVCQDDARDPNVLDADSVDLVVTSPPYPNNYDYADATRIEMTFLGEIESWGDLQNAVRVHLVRSCSQHMAGYDAQEALEAPCLEPIRRELQTVYQALTLERSRHGGRKAYNSMVVAYFHDLAKTWIALRRFCRRGAQALFIVGDSAPYAVHVPVERWLGELALAAGFEKWTFRKLRDRNVKWKNRKHRVPLHEGLLTVEG